MVVDRPPGWTDTVRQNWKETQGFLLASTEPCLSIRDDELAAVRDNRVLVGVGLDDLAGGSVPKPSSEASAVTEPLTPPLQMNAAQAQESFGA